MPQIRGAWKWNDYVDTKLNLDEPVDFVSGGFAYSGLKIESSFLGSTFTYKGSVVVFQQVTGNKLLMETTSIGDNNIIDFGLTPQDVSDSFYNFLTANATKLPLGLGPKPIYQKVGEGWVLRKAYQWINGSWVPISGAGILFALLDIECDGCELVENSPKVLAYNNKTIFKIVATDDAKILPSAEKITSDMSRIVPKECVSVVFDDVRREAVITVDLSSCNLTSVLDFDVVAVTPIDTTFDTGVVRYTAVKAQASVASLVPFGSQHRPLLSHAADATLRAIQLSQMYASDTIFALENFISSAALVSSTTSNLNVDDEGNISKIDITIRHTTFGSADLVELLDTLESRWLVISDDTFMNIASLPVSSVSGSKVEIENTITSIDLRVDGICDIDRPSEITHNLSFDSLAAYALQSNSFNPEGQNIRMVINDLTANIKASHAFVARPPSRPLVVRFDSYDTALLAAQTYPISELIDNAISSLQAGLLSANSAYISLEVLEKLSASSRLDHVGSYDRLGVNFNQELMDSSMTLEHATCIEAEAGTEYQLQLQDSLTMEHADILESQVDFIVNENTNLLTKLDTSRPIRMRVLAKLIGRLFSSEANVGVQTEFDILHILSIEAIYEALIEANVEAQLLTYANIKSDMLIDMHSLMRVRVAIGQMLNTLSEHDDKDLLSLNENYLYMMSLS